MREGSEKRIDRIRVRAEMRGQVADAKQDAVAKVGLKHGMSPENVKAACEAVTTALENDVVTSDVETLQRLAEDAAEKSVALFRFADSNIMADLYVALDDELNARLKAEEMK